ncbi:hypothetical protein HOP50_17g80560 [Chloropicon primus]|uniref:Uncharacterized protein n=1 Tax=Chloropicon primus TaxID=1764295 RepID=A0A5B8N196_9CHLO|nr:hypothetical protein A3770_17p80320 [Chloropicon primus]UPR04711.1 hypothetical protein HOP50_17g80560 [Chloropicon primus]|mmetsp:Transcript_1293/g.2953  ORF Transcript_1293/g.2953 Transcript_1293/m.2953 type:complete len:201 (-) Transcript_1293:491-1093(-)|eukprot:QDZ25514.1 hypothetical protein A3770_17p80320 [Chloropicon primus]
MKALVVPRRSFVASVASLTFAGSTRNARALQEDGSKTTDAKKTFLAGRIFLPPGYDDDAITTTTTTSPAVYVTARPSKASSVPRAILDGSNGKAPPCLASRIPIEVPRLGDAFPLEFSLSSQDLTMEGAQGNAEQGSYWFQDEDLVVSVRYDTDGIAATRDANDLVGRAEYRRDKEASGPVVVQLQGRGFGGKLVTRRAK